VATRIPKRAGYQSPIFFKEGAKTPGKLKTIHIKPSIQTIVMRTGRLIAALCMVIGELVKWRFRELKSHSKKILNVNQLFTFAIQDPNAVSIVI
jgi:hypothetical protein